MRWDCDVSKQVKDGVSSTNIMSNSFKGNVKYVDKIESYHPGYLHYLYRQATKVKGPKAGFAELAFVMNEKRRVPSKLRTSTNISRYQLNKWFN